MLHVNLIGARQRERQAHSKVTAECMLAGFVVLCLALWLAGPKVAKGYEVRRDIAKYEKQIADNEARADAVQRMKDESEQLAPVFTMVRESQYCVVDWLRVLMHIEQEMPRGVWAEQIASEFEQDDWSHKVKVHGKAARQADVAEAMVRIGRRTPFDEKRMTLVQTNVSKTSDEEYIEFSFDAGLNYVIGEYLQ